MHGGVSPIGQDRGYHAIKFRPVAIFGHRLYFLRRLLGQHIFRFSTPMVGFRKPVAAMVSACCVDGLAIDCTTRPRGETGYRKCFLNIRLPVRIRPGSLMPPSLVAHHFLLNHLQSSATLAKTKELRDGGNPLARCSFGFLTRDFP